jgi:16S rRNA processing protein RimM
MAVRPTGDTSRSDRHVVLGRIAGAHGVHGRVRVTVFGDGPEHLLAAPWLELSFAQRDPLHDVARRRYEVAGAAPGRPGEVRLALAGVSDRDAAAALRGALVLGDAALLAPLAEGEHYWFELVGCRVELEGGTPLGTVREIWETGAHDVLVVEDDAGRSHLIPAADAFLRLVDPAAGRIVVSPIPGLLADDAGG